MVARREVGPRDMGDLGAVLGQVRLRRAVGMRRGQRAGLGQLRRGRGDREARRDGVPRPAPAMPAGDQRLGLVMGALRRVQQRLGRVAVHRRLAARHPKTPPKRLGEICMPARGGDAPVRDPQRAVLAPRQRRRVVTGLGGRARARPPIRARAVSPPTPVAGRRARNVPRQQPTC